MLNTEKTLPAMLGSLPPAAMVSLPDHEPERTRETLKWMRQLVRHGKCSPVIRATAVNLVRDIPKRPFLQICTLFEFVRDQVAFVHDISEVETVHFAEQVLKQGAGDCDDKSIVLSALLEAVGFSTRLIAVGFIRGQFSHVYCEVKYGGGWLGLDASVESASPGWRPPAAVEIMAIRNSC